MENRYLAATLVAASVLFVVTAQAATPEAGTLNDTTRELSYDAGPFLVRNASAGAIVTDEVCANPALPCDEFTLTIDLSDAYRAAHPDDIVVMQWKWSNPLEDYDFRIFDADGNVVTTAGTASDPENAIIGAHNGVYTIRGVPFLVAGGSFEATLKLESASVAPVPPPAAGPVPEYVAWGAPDALDGNTGEPSIGYNPATNRIMYLSGTTTLRASFPETLAEPLPEVCDPLWEDKTYVYTGVITSDPILFTDQGSGRTFVAQMHIPIPVPPTALGLNSLFAYTDDDGESWLPGQIGPPEGGYDHETVGSGPYPESLAVLRTPVNGGRAVYYCSQAGFTAFCARSDTGGLTFPTGFPIYDAVRDGFGGIHGHVHVAPDGTVYVPVKACGDQQCVTMSENGGVTWEVRRVPGSTPGASDPSVGIATDGSLYFCYVNGDGHPHVAVSNDKGLSWGKDHDIGAAHGIVNSVFPEVVAGDPDRAACAFLGTTQGGNYQAFDFPGVWYGYVASTYDGGESWHSVNATPNDPVQRESGVWLGGGGAGNRNLLDFNEITIDRDGYVLFGFADGCIENCVNGGANSFTAKASIARQVGGRPLFAAHDPLLPAAPKAACLAGSRDQNAAHLTWRVPASGDRPITAYKVYRGSTDSDLAYVGQTDGKARFDDFTADPSVTSYRYRVTAVNSLGESVRSNPVDLPVVPVVEESSCALPGITLYRDAAGDPDPAGTPGQDLLFAAIAEPKDLPGKLVLTMKVDDLSSPPPSTRWATYYDAPDGASRYVAMVTTDGAPAFEVGVKGSDPSGNVGTFTPDGTPDPASTYDADGTIAIVLDKAALGFADGDVITGLSSVVRSSAPGTGSGLTVDDTSAAEYTLRGTSVCNVAPPPVANPPVQPPLLGQVEDKGRFGGAPSLWLLGPMLLAGLRRRR